MDKLPDDLKNIIFGYLYPMEIIEITKDEKVYIKVLKELFGQESLKEYEELQSLENSSIAFRLIYSYYDIKNCEKGIKVNERIRDMRDILVFSYTYTTPYGGFEKSWRCGKISEKADRYLYEIHNTFLSRHLHLCHKTEEIYNDWEVFGKDVFQIMNISDWHEFYQRKFIKVALKNKFMAYDMKSYYLNPNNWYTMRTYEKVVKMPEYQKLIK